MRNKLIIVALIAVILATGMVLLGCGAKCPGDGKCEINWSSISDISTPKYCGTSITDTKELETAMECAVYKFDTVKAAADIAAGKGYKVSCDCGG